MEFILKKIIAASNNKNKIREIKEILGELDIEIMSLKEAGIDIDPDENSDSFTGNALIKAREAALHTKLPVIADDSGLSVDCLDGRPGVKSKRFAGPMATDSDNNKYLIKVLSENECEDNSAHFVCVIAFIDENRKEHTFKGYCHGEIISDPAGINGFGYDPHFFVPRFNKTMAQMNDSEKNSVSHRGMALGKLKDYLKGLDI